MCGVTSRSRRSATMQLVLATLSALACCAAATLAAAGHAKKMPTHKKYFIGGGNQKNIKLVNERAIDSYFRILKSSPKSFAVLPDGDRSYAPIARGGVVRTEPPLRHLKQVEKKMEQEIKNDARKDQNLEHANPISDANQPSRRDDEEILKEKQKEYFRNPNDCDKHNINTDEYKLLREPNAHKLMTKMNDRRAYLAQSLHQKMHTSGVKDKILHKSNVNSERNAQSMARMLNDITLKVIDRNSQKEREYKKRHTIDKVTNGQHHYDKEIEKNGYHKNGSEENSIKKLEIRNMPARIGDYGVGRQVIDPPYALFYRMNHEDFEQPDQLAADGRTTIEDLDDNTYYAGSVTNYADVNAGRVATKSFSAVNNKNYYNKQYTAFRDR